MIENRFLYTAHRILYDAFSHSVSGAVPSPRRRGVLLSMVRRVQKRVLVMPLRMYLSMNMLWDDSDDPENLVFIIRLTERKVIYVQGRMEKVWAENINYFLLCNVIRRGGGSCAEAAGE